MRVMGAGDGYKYLLRSVASADGERALSTPLTRYYAEQGTPPGRWMGGGLAALGDGEIHEGAPVSEAQLQLLLGMGRDPVTGDPLRHLGVVRLGRGDHHMAISRTLPGLTQRIAGLAGSRAA